MSMFKIICLASGLLLSILMVTMVTRYYESAVQSLRASLIAFTSTIETDEEYYITTYESKNDDYVVYDNPTLDKEDDAEEPDTEKTEQSKAIQQQQQQQQLERSPEMSPQKVIENDGEEEKQAEPRQQQQSYEPPLNLPLTGVEKLKRFPECASSRRLEHPGIGDGPRVQYIHNPKAGGTSIQIATWKWTLARPGSSFMKYDGNSVSGSSTKCPAAAFESTFLAGHRGFGFCRNIERNKRGLFTFTAFRDPVARVMSWYDYNLYKLHEDRAMNVFGKTGMELNDLIKKYNASPQQEYGEQLLRYAGQQQARFMCGYECMGPMAVGNKNYTESYVLQKALENLEKLDVIGITEELDRMVAQLKFHLPQLVPPGFRGFKRDNTFTVKRSIVDDESKAILREWSWVDQTLYNTARKIYAEKQKIAEHCLQLFQEPWELPDHPSDESDDEEETNEMLRNVNISEEDKPVADEEEEDEPDVDNIGHREVTISIKSRRTPPNPRKSSKDDDDRRLRASSPP